MKPNFPQRSDGVNMTYESSTFMYAIAVSIFAIGGMCGGFIGELDNKQLDKIKLSVASEGGEESLVCLISLVSLTAGGWIANKFGRKGGLLMNNLIGIVAAMAMVFSKHVTSYELLIIGRYLIGVNCGLNTSLVPMYISEIAPLNLRGGLGTVNQLAVTVGLLTSQVATSSLASFFSFSSPPPHNFLHQVLGVDYLLGTDEGWPYLLGIAVFPSILQLILLPICPESPRYLLISKGQEQVGGGVCTMERLSLWGGNDDNGLQAAREALKRLRNTPNIEVTSTNNS